MKAVCFLPAIPCRSTPSDKAEMSTQILYGESVSILDENEKWYLVKSDFDGYESWVDKKQLTSMSDNEFDSFNRHPRHRQSAIFAAISHQNPLYVPFGAIVDSDMLPNSTRHPIATDEWTKKLTLCALQLLNCPYLWGGRTPMGYDCSGFIQAIFSVNGISLPRDARQQAEIGETISFIEEAQECDLAFFDNEQGKITHVGMLISNGASKNPDIIHASGFVRLDKFDHQGIFDPKTGQYTHSLRLIKRVSFSNC